MTRPLVVGGLVAVAAGYLAVVDPHQAGHYPTCPFLWLTGRFCPGCGGLRAVHDLMHGHLLAALSSNLVITLLVPVGVLLWARWAFTRSVAAGPESGSGRIVPAWSLWVLLGVLVVFWVLRNLAATAWLAP